MMERQGGKVGHDRDKVFKRKKMTRSSRKKKQNEEGWKSTRKAIGIIIF